MSDPFPPTDPPASSRHETCGWLVGALGATPDEGITWITATNVARDTRCAFGMAPEDTLAVVRAARTRGERLLGFWHSHPSGVLAPSQADRAGLANMLRLHGALLCCIVDAAAPERRQWYRAIDADTWLPLASCQNAEGPALRERKADPSMVSGRAYLSSR